MATNISEEQSVEILTKILTDAGIDFRKKKPFEEGGFFYKENGVLKKFTGNIFVKRLFKFDSDFLLSKVNTEDLFSSGGNEEVEGNVGFECEPIVSKVVNKTSNKLAPYEKIKRKVSFGKERLDVYDCNVSTTLDAA